MYQEYKTPASIAIRVRYSIPQLRKGDSTRGSEFRKKI